jgi:hypothetical protein
MPFVLILVGVVMVVAGVRNTFSQLTSLLAGDFTGQDNFLYWFLSIMIVGSIGYIPKLKPFSNIMLLLLLVVLFLHKGGFFAQFQQALSTTAQPSQSGQAQQGSSGTQGLQSSIGSLIGSVGTIGAMN